MFSKGNKNNDIPRYINNISDIFEHMIKAGFDCLNEKKWNLCIVWEQQMQFNFPDCSHPQEIIAIAKNHILRFSSDPAYSDEKYSNLAKLGLEQLDNLSQAVKAKDIDKELSELRDNQKKILLILNNHNKYFMDMDNKIAVLNNHLPPSYSIDLNFIKEKLVTLEKITFTTQLQTAAMKQEIESHDETAHKKSNKKHSKFF